MKQFEIRVDDDIILRVYQEKDAQLLYDLTESNRFYLREWLGWLDYTKCIKDTKNFILSCLQNLRNGTGLNLGIFYQNILVGSIGFNSISKLNHNAEIGYMLSEEFNGKGIMTKSCKALIDYGFNELDLNRIEIKVATKNTKSRAIPERLKFKQEGILQQAEFLYDHYVDIVVYGMLKENWNYGRSK